MMPGAGLIADLRTQKKILCPMPDQITGVVASKGSAKAQRVDGLEQTGFPGPIGPTEQIDPGSRFKVEQLQIAESLDVQTRQLSHSKRLRSSSASGRSESEWFPQQSAGSKRWIQAFRSPFVPACPQDGKG